MTIRKIRRIIDVQGQTNGDTDQFGICRTHNAGCSGVEGWFKIGAPETDLIRRVNPNQNLFWTTEVKMRYAVWENAGGLFMAPQRERSSTWTAFNLLWGSKSNAEGEYNLVKVLRDEGGYSDIEKIRRADHYDDLSPASHPYFFHRVWCTNRRGKTYDTPKGKIILPLFDMRDFIHANGDITGNWVRNAYLGDAVGEVLPPVEPPPSEFPYGVITLRRTVGRQRPNSKSSSMGVIQANTPLEIFSVSGDWGYSGTRTGWVPLVNVQRTN